MLPSIHPSIHPSAIASHRVASHLSTTFPPDPKLAAQHAVLSCTAGVRLAACIQTERKQSSSGKSQAQQPYYRSCVCACVCERAREASSRSPLDSLQPRASAISRSPSVPPATLTTQPADKHLARRAGSTCSTCCLRHRRLLAPSALTRRKGRSPPGRRRLLWLLGFKGTLDLQA